MSISSMAALASWMLIAAVYRLSGNVGLEHSLVLFAGFHDFSNYYPGTFNDNDFNR